MKPLFWFERFAHHHIATLSSVHLNHMNLNAIAGARCRGPLSRKGHIWSRMT